MRKFIDLITPLFETALPNTDELEAMKSVIAGKIKDLPDDSVTARALREIEELLTHVNAGGRVGMINGELARINDPTVTAAQKMLARYIVSMDVTPAQRDELFSLWREDKLVNRDKLLSKGSNNFSDIIASYSTNPAISELVNDIMRIQALGQGKGEFGLSVLSKNINKPDKGDLLINGRKIEAKTTDGGAGRFTDQEVRPAEGFERAARDLNAYVANNPEIKTILPKSGLSIAAACDIAQQLSDNTDFVAMCKQVIAMIFGGTTSDKSSIDSIADAIASGSTGVAMQAYAKASFNYYMSKKDDEGVLYINLTTEPINTVYFKDAEELADSTLRLHAGTAYITSIADVRLPYPQMEIIPTTFGANAASAAAKKAATAEKKAAKATADAIRNQVDGTTPTTGIRPTGAVSTPATVIDRATRPGSQISEHRRERR
jgi:hypothetical protein